MMTSLIASLEQRDICNRVSVSKRGGLHALGWRIRSYSTSRRRSARKIRVFGDRHRLVKTS